ncbi:MAG: hypothetical protein A2Z17_04410 [Gammaproteobacteria bacterium RBG_16_66_13]|nr:MAG: hypothetical protein A2Z17_04410 [Gammaproteobacteria bacterium RBG_16_66_13]
MAASKDTARQREQLTQWVMLRLGTVLGPPKTPGGQRLLELSDLALASPQKTTRRPLHLLRKHLPAVDTALGQLTAGGIDFMAAALKDTHPASGPDGFRAKFIRNLAGEALTKPDAAWVAHVFRPWVTPNGFLEVLMEGGLRLFPELVLPPRPRPLVWPTSRRTAGVGIPTPRRAPGHPPGLDVETHVRVWTVECLTKLMLKRLTVVDALWKWNAWFLNNTWDENSIEDTQRSRFHHDRNRVAEELARLVPHIPPRRRGRPRRPLLPSDLLSAPPGR